MYPKIITIIFSETNGNWQFYTNKEIFVFLKPTDYPCVNVIKVLIKLTYVKKIDQGKILTSINVKHCK